MLEFSDSVIKQIIEWKKEHIDIYCSRISDVNYIYRTLTKEEYKNLLSIQEMFGYDIQDLILKLCLLKPEYNYNRIQNTLAGEVEVLTSQIISVSGFSKQEDIIKDIEDSRKSMSFLENQIVALICKAFPHLTPEDINKFNYQKLLRYVAFSEIILDTELTISKAEDQNTIDFQKDNENILGKGASQGMRVPPSMHRGDVG